MLFCIGSFSVRAEVKLSCIIEVEMLSILVQSGVAATGTHVHLVVLDGKLNFIPPASVSISHCLGS